MNEVFNQNDGFEVWGWLLASEAALATWEQFQTECGFAIEGRAPIGEIISAVIRGKAADPSPFEGAPDHSKANRKALDRSLARCGVMIVFPDEAQERGCTEGIYVCAAPHPVLDEIFRGSPWGRSWVKALRKIAADDDGRQFISFSGTLQLAMRLDVGFIDDHQLYAVFKAAS